MSDKRLAHNPTIHPNNIHLFPDTLMAVSRNSTTVQSTHLLPVLSSPQKRPRLPVTCSGLPVASPFLDYTELRLFVDRKHPDFGTRIEPTP